MTTSRFDESPEVVITSDRGEFFVEATPSNDHKTTISITVLGCCGGCYVTNTVSEEDLMEAIHKSKRNYR